MSAYPQSFPAMRDALLAWTPHPVVADAIYATHGQASPVVQAVGVFDALKGRVGEEAAPAEGDAPTLVLDRDGLKLLAGVAHMIAEHGFYQKGGEAIPQLIAATAALAALPPEETPPPLIPPPEGGE